MQTIITRISRLLFAATLLLLAAGITSAAYHDLPATAPATQSADDLDRMAFRADEFFLNGQYGDALPLLQRIARSYQDQPERIGPVEEEIRVCQKNVADATTQPAAAPRIMQVQARKPHPAIGPNDVYETTLENLGNFPYDDQDGGVIPDDVKALDGKHVRIAGFMQATEEAEHITHFALVGSLFACSCQFGGAPHIRHTVFVTTPQGKAIDYCSDRIVVEGVLHVREQRDEGFIIGLFDVDASSVQPAK